MTQEALAIGDRQPLPDALSLITYRVHHHLPGQPLLLRASDILADLPQPLAQRSAIVFAWPGVTAAAQVAAGQQPAA